MSILSRRPRLRTLKTRTTKPGPDFALGLDDNVRVIREWTVGNVTLFIIEDDLWYEREEPTARFTLVAVANERRLERKSFDSADDARVYAETLYPAPSDGWHALDLTPPAPGRPFEPTDADRRWWATNCPASRYTVRRNYDRQAAESRSHDYLEAGLIPPDLADDLSRTSLVGHPA